MVIFSPVGHLDYFRMVLEPLRQLLETVMDLGSADHEQKQRCLLALALLNEEVDPRRDYAITVDADGVPEKRFF